MPRSRRPRLTHRRFIRTLQLLRLEGLEAGRFEPLSDREAFYQRLFQDGRRPDREDFILSPPLFRLEAILVDMEDEADALEPPFTPTPEPAISPP